MPGEEIIRLIVDHIAPRKQAKKISVGVLATGNGSNLQALIDFSKRAECSFEICSVISNNPESRALTRANGEGIPNYLVDHRRYGSKQEFEAKLVTYLANDGVELVVLAGFLRVLSQVFLRQFTNRVINLHPSLLPKHPGLNAIETALIADDAESGCTVHLVDQGLDTGPIIEQRSCAIISGDELETLTMRIRKLEHDLLPSVVNRIAKMVATRDFA